MISLRAAEDCPSAEDFLLLYFTVAFLAASTSWESESYSLHRQNDSG